MNLEQGEIYFIIRVLFHCQVGKENVKTALSLVGYGDDIEAAMRFVFGGAFVCKDMNVAKKVTYDDRIMRRSVTLEGDSIDPAGTLTGGEKKREVYCQNIGRKDGK